MHWETLNLCMNLLQHKTRGHPVLPGPVAILLQRSALVHVHRFLEVRILVLTSLDKAANSSWKVLWGHCWTLLRAQSGSCDVQRHVNGLQFSEKHECNSQICCCFRVDRKPSVLRSRQHRHQHHLEKEKPGRVLEFSRTFVRIRWTVWSHVPADPHLCVWCYPITALIEHCLTPLISWKNNKSFSVHISVSRRHLVEKSWLNLPIALLRLCPGLAMIWPRAGHVHFIIVGGKLPSWRLWFFFSFSSLWNWFISAKLLSLFFFG